MVPRSSALERLLQPTEGDLPAEYARKLLAIDFSASDQARYTELAEKAQLGELSNDEKNELDDLLTANDVLTILQSKARTSLSKTPAV